MTGNKEAAIYCATEVSRITGRTSTWGYRENGKEYEVTASRDTVDDTEAGHPDNGRIRVRRRRVN